MNVHAKKRKNSYWNHFALLFVTHMKVSFLCFLRFKRVFYCYSLPHSTLDLILNRLKCSPRGVIHLLILWVVPTESWWSVLFCYSHLIMPNIYLIETFHSLLFVCLYFILLCLFFYASQSFPRGCSYRITGLVRFCHCLGTREARLANRPKVSNCG